MDQIFKLRLQNCKYFNFFILKIMIWSSSAQEAFSLYDWIIPADKLLGVKCLDKIILKYLEKYCQIVLQKKCLSFPLHELRTYFSVLSPTLRIFLKHGLLIGEYLHLVLIFMSLVLLRGKNVYIYWSFVFLLLWSFQKISSTKVNIYLSFHYYILVPSTVMYVRVVTQ